MEINFTCLTLPVVRGVVSPLKAAGDKLLMNKSIRAKFWWRSYAKKRYILNVWEPIPLKLNRELEQWWKCNKVVFGLIDCASLRCYELPKLRFCKTRLPVQVFFSWRTQHFLILPLIDQLKQPILGFRVPLKVVSF